MTISKLVKENLKDARMMTIGAINRTLLRLKNSGFEPEIDLNDLKGNSIVFRELDDQFSDIVGKVTLDSVEVNSSNAGEDFDVPFEELPTEMLLAILEVIEENEDEIFAIAKNNVDPNSHD